MSSHWQSLHFSPQHTRGISTWSKQYSRPWGLYRQPIKNLKKSLCLKTLHPRGQEVVKALERNAPWRSSPGLASWQVCAEGRGGGVGEASSEAKAPVSLIKGHTFPDEFESHCFFSVFQPLIHHINTWDGCWREEIKKEGRDRGRQAVWLQDA